jgi:antitoxin ParD1/3/4
LLSRDQVGEGWLHKDMAAACDALEADPSRAVDAAGIKARLADTHKKASAGA